MAKAPVILWLRRDFRLHDHEALHAALDEGGPVIPVFIHDELCEALGAAPRWRMGEAVAAFAARLEEMGSRLVLRRGSARAVLEGLVAETGACAVHWSRAYDPAAIKRDREVKAALKEAGVNAQSHKGHLLFEPWDVQTKQGGPYKVYTPYWNAVRGRQLAAPLATVGDIPSPETWPDTEALGDWEMGADMNRGADVVALHATVGERAAQGRMAAFLGDKIAEYQEARNLPAETGTSNLSENLSYGEISPRALWHAGWRRIEEGASGAQTWVKELVWREFAAHLLYHYPQMDERNWREEWNGFDWRRDNNDAAAWRKGRTGEPFVDAAMRELYVTGRMHNRARMIVASYLTKHLLTDWRVGLRWFEECLIDWDPASNALGWQWVAGSGPDATPYFRIFNPATQADKFDPEGDYRKAWLAEGQAHPTKTALSFFDAIPRSWEMSAEDDPPERLIGLKEGREKALAAYDALKQGRKDG